MATQSPQKLLQLWAREEITVEMAIGHILQNLVALERTLEGSNISLYRLRADVDSLLAGGNEQRSMKNEE